MVSVRLMFGGVCICIFILVFYILGAFLMKQLDALRAFTRASQRKIKLYFTSNLIEHNINK